LWQSLNRLSLEFLNEAESGALVLHFVDFREGDDERIEAVARSVGARDDVIFVHAPV